jgi:hypothetical protein
MASCARLVTALFRRSQDLKADYQSAADWQSAPRVWQFGFSSAVGIGWLVRQLTRLVLGKTEVKREEGLRIVNRT